MNNIDKLIALNLEMEGLLRIVKERSSQDAKKRFYDALTEYVSISENSAYTTENDESAFNTEPVEPTPVEEFMPDEEIPAEMAEAIITTFDEDEKIEADETEPETEEEEVLIQTDMAAEDSVKSDDTTETVDDSELPDNEPGEQLRVDEMLTKREARDLRKAFTLNDKFRFRRELFCNNDPLFISTLNILSSMKSLDEAERYLTDNMGWDPESEDFKDFVAIIANHY